MLVTVLNDETGHETAYLDNIRLIIITFQPNSKNSLFTIHRVITLRQNENVQCHTVYCFNAAKGD